MNVFNDNAPIDYVDYFTNQLPKDLAAMAKLRDELAKRQGAMTAVDDANRLRTEAQAVLADARAQAANLVNTAKAEYDGKMGELAAAQKKLDDTLKTLAKREKDFDNNYNVKTAELTKREAQLTALQTNLDAQEADLVAREAKVKSDRIALDARIKAFQDKVAALAV
jgi:chromosome segregation ATPase